MGADAVPNLVRDVLVRDRAYDFGLGVVLRAPTEPSGAGGSASYRVDYRVQPVVPGKPKARRRQAYARDLGEAFGLTQATFEQMQQRAGGTFVEYHTDVPFGQVAQRWLDSPHPRWGEQYPDKVRSLLRNWLLADRITVAWQPGGPPQRLADLPIGAITADHCNQALEHIRQRRAYRTYTEVHGLLIQILKWALTNRYMRPTDGRIVDQLPLAQSYDASGGVGGTRAIPAEEIPPTEKVIELAVTAARLFDDRTAGLIYLLAFGGLRISECLALRRDDRFRQGPDGSWRIEIREPVHKSRRKTLPPKWRKRRWAFAPDWLTDDLDRLLADTDPGALLFASPGRPVRGPDGTVTRIGRGLYPYSNWRERTWEKLVAATPDWPEREDWWDPSAGPAPAGRQTERRWLWPIHSLRHIAATYQLNTLGLDPDVAKFLGHRSGVQVWEMYVRVRPDLFGRAAAASRAAGDPRAK
ncbi:site-specific integrase [Nitriliruptor alkaliphilus]|uniref:site-specific integrase n=1 Tax=Nitriliruptor alkaliphilus TaxID=427918 RepID=UPI000696BA34|nr:site-specific integrase [Nitriliruptor alkaliphilus]